MWLNELLLPKGSVKMDKYYDMFWALYFVNGRSSCYGLFYNQGTSSKITLQPCFNCRSLLWFQSAFAKTLIRVRSTYSNKEKVRINQLFKKKCSFVMILSKIAVSFGFSQILCSSITWNKHKESLFVNSEKIIWTRPFKGVFINTLVGGLGKMEGGPEKFWVAKRGGPKSFP